VVKWNVYRLIYVDGIIQSEKQIAKNLTDDQLNAWLPFLDRRTEFYSLKKVKTNQGGKDEYEEENSNAINQ